MPHAGTLFWVIVLAGLLPAFAPRWFHHVPLDEAFVAWDRQVVWIRLSEVATILLYIADVYVWRWTFPLTPWPGGATVAGLALALAGVILTVWTRRCLGAFFSTTLGVKRDHQVIKTGPYRWVRHPMYSSLLLVILGGALVYNSGAVVVLLALPFTTFFYWQSAVEERLLVKRLGEAYLQYRASTGRLVPRVVSFQQLTDGKFGNNH
jgi:protein-S-isoprenylcysteine O-methyltransferase Ste14